MSDSKPIITDEDGAAATRTCLRLRSRGTQTKSKPFYELQEEENEKPARSYNRDGSRNCNKKPKLSPAAQNPLSANKTKTLVSNSDGTFAYLLPHGRVREPKNKNWRGTAVEQNPNELVQEFSDIDVMFGRGNHVNKLKGNIRFRQKIHPLRELYMGSKDCASKREILLQAYDAVLEGGARFLEIVSWNPSRNEVGDMNYRGLFRPVPLYRVLEKVAQALREPKWVPPPPEKKIVIAPKTTGSGKAPEAATPDSYSQVSAAASGLTNQVQSLIFKHVLLDNADEEVVKEEAEREEKEKITVEYDYVVVGPESMSMSLSGQGALDEDGRAQKEGEESRTQVEESYENLKESDGAFEDPDFEFKGELPLGNKQEANLKKKYRDVVDPFDPDDKLYGLGDLKGSDVLFGRGHHVNSNAGNILFRKVISKNKGIYVNLPMYEKRPMALSIYKQFGGRFLEAVTDDKATQSTDGKPKTMLFRKVSIERCLEKICQALRGKYTYVVESGSQDHSGNSKHSIVSSSATTGPDVPDEVLYKASRAGFAKKSQCSSLSPHGGEPTGTMAGLVVSPEEGESSKSEKRCHSATFNELTIGSRIDVYWPMDRAFYEAVVEDRKTVTSTNPKDNGSSSCQPIVLHFIKYVLDDEKEWINLNEHDYNLLSLAAEEPSTKAKPKPGQVVRIMKEGQVVRHTARRSFFWRSDVNGEKNNEGKVNISPTISSETVPAAVGSSSSAVDLMC